MASHRANESEVSRLVQPRALHVRIEKAHETDPNFTRTPDPFHTVDHLHIDHRKNVNY